MSVEFWVLGPLEARLNGAPIRIPAGHGRALLATLLLRSNTAVSVDELVDRLWNGAPPSPGRAKATLHMVVTRLRRSLGEANRVRTSTDGYLIEIGPDELDLQRFRALRDQGRLVEALALWRGAPLADVRSDSLHRDEVPVLIAEHLDVLERRIEADLSAGQSTTLVVELRALTREHPLKERFWAQLMLALYRSDQQAEALAAYRAVRGFLDSELGVEPGPALVRLHQKILAADRELVIPGTPTRAEVPRQLPPLTHGFVGRTAELAAVEAVGQPTILVLHGPGGVGKTALALRWAHEVVHRFPDGQLYLDLRGFSPSGRPVEPAAAAETLLSALGVENERMPSGLDRRTALLRTLFADRKMLLLLDNAASSSQIIPLLPGTGSTIVIVTTRNQLRDLAVHHEARRIELRQLELGEAVELLSVVLGAGRVEAEPDVVTDIVRSCAGFPLALKVFAERAARFPDTRLHAFAAELHDEGSRLDALGSLDGGVADLRTVFSWSYRALDSTAARLFRLLGLHPGPDIGLMAAAALLGEPVAPTRRHLERLDAAHLVRSSAPGRYDLHDLLKAYSIDLAPDDGEAALRRLVWWYVHSAWAFAVKFPPQADLATEEPPPDGVVPKFEDVEAAGKWGRDEWPNLLAVTRAAAKRGWHDLAWRIPDGMWALRGFVPASEVLEAQEISAQSVDLAGAVDQRGRVLCHLAAAHSYCDDVDAAIKVYSEALELAKKAQDLAAECVVLINMGATYGRDCRHVEAIELQSRGLEIAEVLDNPRYRGVAHFNLALHLHYLGRRVEAEDHGERALTVFLELDDEYHYGRALSTRARCHLADGLFEDAEATIREGLEIVRKFGDLNSEANQLDELGTALLCLGRPEEAKECWSRAVEIMADFDESWCAVVRTWLSDFETPNEGVVADNRSGS